MPKRNPALEAALELCNGYKYRLEGTKDRHIKLLIEGAKKVVYISGPAKGRDLRWIDNVKQDVRHAIRSINNG